VGTTTAAASSHPANVSIDASQTDPNTNRVATHAVVFTVRDESVSAEEGLQFDEILINYRVGDESADVSNVGPKDIDQIGIDENGANEPDDGTQIDTRQANLSDVSGTKDNMALEITTKSNLGPIDASDEIVVVMQDVQPPQNGGNYDAEVTLNGQDSATDTVKYEYNSASVLLGNQTTTGDSVVVERVNLSEGGWIAVHNDTGDTPGEVRGNSSYLEPGVHTDVEIPLDPPVESDAQPELHATVHLDTNANRQWDYVDSGGDKDIIYRTRDGNPQTGNGDSDSTATITYNEPPTAEANGRYRVDEGGTVTLDASGSSDPDGDVVDTSWTVTSGPGSVSGDTYDAPDDTDGDTFAVVEVTVTDDDGDTDTKEARIDIPESDTGSDDDGSDGTGSGDGGSTSTPTDDDSGSDGTSTGGDSGDDGTPTPTPTDNSSDDDGSGSTGDDGTADGGSDGDSDGGDATDETQDDGTQDNETSGETPTPTPADGIDTPTETGSGSAEIGGLGGTSLVILPLVALVLLIGGLYAVFGRRERE